MNKKIIYENNIFCTYCLKANSGDKWIFNIYLITIIIFLSFITYIICKELIKYVAYSIINYQNNVWMKSSYYAYTQQWLLYILILELETRTKSINETYHHYSKIGGCFYKLKHYKQSLNYYLKFLEHEPKNINVLDKISKIYQINEVNYKANLIHKKIINRDSRT